MTLDKSRDVSSRRITVAVELTKRWRRLAFIIGSFLLSSFGANQVLAEVECEQGERPFEHALGESCIPQNPRRVVTLSGFTAAPLIEFGVPIIGTGGDFNKTTGRHEISYVTQLFGLDFSNSDITQVSDGFTPNLETIASIQPDLIVVDPYYSQFHENLARIAPTVVPIDDGTDFMAYMRFHADIAGQLDEFERLKADYDAKIEFIKEVLGDPGNITVSWFEIQEGSIQHPSGFGAVDRVVVDIGFQSPPLFVGAQPGASLNYSLEKIQDADGDIIISSFDALHTNTPEKETEYRDQVAPIWRRLSAVEEGNFYWVDRNTWYAYTFKSLHEVSQTLLTLTLGREF